MKNYNNNEIAKREIEKGYITYRTLADYVGDMILNNNLYNHFEDWELINGTDNEFYNENNKEITEKEYFTLEEQGKNCYLEFKDIYQFYIITPSGADFLQNNSDEIIYYNEELDIYLWAIDHFGTSWDYVFTDIEVQ